jgi:hypothetical protein
VLGAPLSIRRASARISGQMSAATMSPAPSNSTTAAIPSRLPVTDISEPGGTGGTGRTGSCRASVIYGRRAAMPPASEGELACAR